MPPNRQPANPTLGGTAVSQPLPSTNKKEDGKSPKRNWIINIPGQSRRMYFASPGIPSFPPNLPQTPQQCLFRPTANVKQDVSIPAPKQSKQGERSKINPPLPLSSPTLDVSIQEYFRE